MELRKAERAQIDRILEIMDSARAYQRSCGFTQWEDGYPGKTVIEDDINAGQAYALMDGGIIVAYSVLAIGDSEYDLQADRWKYEGSYGVVHRIAVAPEARGKNVSDILFREYERLYKAMDIPIIRIDTGLENKIMQHLMDKFGYESRGLMTFRWGKRLAFEKRIL